MFPSLPSRLAAAAVGARAAFSRAAMLRGALVAAMLAVSACNTNNVLGLRPDVDVGTQTAAVPSGGGMQDLVPDDPYLQAADAARSVETSRKDQPADISQPVDMAQPIDSMQPADIGQPADTTQPIDIAQMMQPVDPAPANVAPIDSGQPVETDEPAASEEPAAPVLAAYPRVSSPMESPRIVMPADEAACRRELKGLGVAYQELSPINDGGSCRIDHPIKVSVPAWQCRAEAGRHTQLRNGADFREMDQERAQSGRAPALLEQGQDDPSNVQLLMPSHQPLAFNVRALERQCARYRPHRTQQRP